MSAEDVARAHYEARRRLTSAVGDLARQQWSRVHPSALDTSWAGVAPTMLVGITGAQLAAARMADGYVGDALDEQDLPPDASGALVPDMLAGVASDGRPLDSLLQNPITVVKSAIGAGVGLDRAMASGYANLDMIARTQVADAGRVADHTALVAHNGATGYTRHLSPPSCSRCAVLAGRFYQWNAGFKRHPRCDCIHVPGAGDSGLRTDPRAYFDSLSGAEQDKAFTKAGAAAIRDGADMGRVVNARRGMYDAAGKSLTTEATTVRGIGRVRLMPEQIFAEAKGDRAEALRLLERHGYIRRTGPRLTRRPVAVRPQVSAAASDQLDLIAAELNADRPAFDALAKRATTAGFDVQLERIGARQGFDALPKVGTRAELDEAVRSGWTESWRGVVGSESGATAAQINARLRTGAYEPGRGIYGNGYYTSERRMTAETYRQREPKTNFPAGGGADFEPSDIEGEQEPDSLLRIAIDPAARVADYDELLAEQERWLKSVEPGSPAALAFADVGRFAAARGYDVIRIAGKHTDGGFYPGWEDAEDDMGGAVQYAILNRARALIQRAQDIP